MKAMMHDTDCDHLWRFNEPTGTIAYDSVGSTHFYDWSTIASSLGGGYSHTASANIYDTVITTGTFKDYARKFVLIGSGGSGMATPYRVFGGPNGCPPGTTATTCYRASYAFTLEIAMRLFDDATDGTLITQQTSTNGSDPRYYTGGASIETIYKNNNMIISFSKTFGAGAAPQLQWEYYSSSLTSLYLVDFTHGTQIPEGGLYSHLALVYEADAASYPYQVSCKWFVNGDYKGIVYTASASSDGDLAQGTLLGNVNNGTAPFDGVMEELRVSYVAKTHEQIRDSSLRCFNARIHEGPPVLTSITMPNFSSSYDRRQDLMRLRLNFSKHMSMTTLVTSSYYDINPNTATIVGVTASYTQRYCDLILSDVDQDTLYYVTASTSLKDIDMNALPSGSNVIPFRLNKCVRTPFFEFGLTTTRTVYHMRGKIGNEYFYWPSYDAPDKNGAYAPSSGMTDIVIDDIYYE